MRDSGTLDTIAFCGRKGRKSENGGGRRLTFFAQRIILKM